MGTESAGDRLSDDELRVLAQLLARFATHDLDQFEHWIVETPTWGKVFIDMMNQMPRDGRGESAYTVTWPLPPRFRLPPDVD